MRLVIVPLVLFAAGSARICDSDDKAKAGATGAASADVSSAIAGGAGLAASLRRPRIGGTVASAGDLSVEVGLHEGGRVEALVSDAQGKLVTENIKLVATAQAKGGAAEKVDLAFVPARGRFEGRAKAGVELQPGPVDVALDVGGKAHGCKLHAAAVAPRPKLGGNVLVAGGFSAEMFARPSGEVQAFIRDSAGAELKADADAKFKAVATAKGGAKEEIALSFDPPHACFMGKAKAGVELEPGPLELAVDAKVGAGIGALEKVALSVDASHSGQLVAVGDFGVELVAKGPEISAFVVDASGKAHAAGDLDLKLDVGADAGTNLALKWDAPCLCYKAKAAANLDLSIQPIRVSLVAAGKAFAGAVASLNAAAKANFNAKANLDAKADLDAKAKLDANAKLDPKLDAKAKLDANAKLDPKLDAKAKATLTNAANASVKVTPPKVDVAAKAGAGGTAKAGAGAKASGGFSIGTK